MRRRLLFLIAAIALTLPAASTAERSSTPPRPSLPPNPSVECRVTAARTAECRGWRVGPAQPSASRWWSTLWSPIPLANVAAVFVGHGPTCIVVAQRFDVKGKDDPAELWCWGEGFEPTLGMTQRGYVTSDAPVKIWEGPDLDAVAVGWQTVCIVEGRGAVRCWGAVPARGQQPTGARIFKGKKVETVSVGRDWVCVSGRRMGWRCWDQPS